MIKLNKKDATYKMIKEEFEALSTEIVTRAFIGDDCQYMDSDFIELRCFIEGDNTQYGEIEEITVGDDGISYYYIDGEIYEEIDLEHEYEDILPMWGTMWLTDFNGLIGYRLQNNDNFLRQLSEIGFRVWETMEGYLLGIDGAGYDFYEEHWIPLYNLLGLKWHNID